MNESLRLMNQPRVDMVTSHQRGAHRVFITAGKKLGQGLWNTLYVR